MALAKVSASLELVPKRPGVYSLVPQAHSVAAPPCRALALTQERCPDTPTRLLKDLALQVLLEVSHRRYRKGLLAHSLVGSWGTA